MATLLIDNNDSFTYNLAHLIGDKVDVIRVDHMVPGMIDQYSHVVISPGPGAPEDYPLYQDIINRAVAIHKPILGICLGHQLLVAHFGGVVGRAPFPVHGKTDIITHQGHNIFADLPVSFEVVRYHSLVALNPGKLNVIACNNDGLCMAVAHAQLPFVGLQFHPESILSEYGMQLVGNFLRF